ncbi:MAG: hypothetical protein VB078_04980 [Clostridiaceae bacterium]|nr:hypothetical protein [Clostridiaceae bacterium]
MSRPKIISTDAYDNDPDKILVELENGAILILELSSKLSDPLFAEIKELSLPKTDGTRVYWSNGANLSLDEIICMLTDEP